MAPKNPNVSWILSLSNSWWYSNVKVSRLQCLNWGEGGRMPQCRPCYLSSMQCNVRHRDTALSSAPHSVRSIIIKPQLIVAIEYDIATESKKTSCSPAHHCSAAVVWLSGLQSPADKVLCCGVMCSSCQPGQPLWSRNQFLLSQSDLYFRERDENIGEQSSPGHRIMS